MMTTRTPTAACPAHHKHKRRHSLTRVSGMNTPALFLAAGFSVVGYLAFRHVKRELSGKGYGPRVFDFSAWIWVGVSGLGAVVMLLFGLGVVGG